MNSTDAIGTADASAVLSRLDVADVRTVSNVAEVETVIGAIVLPLLLLAFASPGALEEDESDDEHRP